jgi:tetratricopeptide (TPR) repeat protein
MSPDALNPSRNGPCPCGSGKKHKLCCLPKAAKASSWPLLQPAAPRLWEIAYEPVDILSNEVNALIRAGEFDKAEKACRKLLETYPNEIAGLRRSAQLEETRGNLEKAVELYYRARDFAGMHEGFDAEVIARYDGEARRVEKRLRQRSPDQKHAQESGSTAQEPAP